MRVELAALAVADRPGRWRALGFAVRDDRVVVGAIEVRLGGEGRGITGWTLRGVVADRGPDRRRHPGLGSVSKHRVLDGLTTCITSAPAPDVGQHPNRAMGIDHVVVVTPDFDRTSVALERAAMPLRRVQPDDAGAAHPGEAGSRAGGFRQGFRRLGPTVLELVEAPSADAVAFWGLVIVVPDLQAPGEWLAPHLDHVRDAVQPGRHIATLGRGAGLSTRVAFMDPDS